MNSIIGLIFIAVLGAATTLAYHKGYSDSANKYQLECTAKELEQTKKYAEDLKAYRQKEQDWAKQAEELKKENQREVSEINARHATIVNSLRKRPERSKDFKPSLPEAPSACSGVSGAELARGDGEFLARYAADAEKLAKALKQCEQQYNETQ